jgi:hypothetical protein
MIRVMALVTAGTMAPEPEPVNLAILQEAA